MGTRIKFCLICKYKPLWCSDLSKYFCAVLTFCSSVLWNWHGHTIRQSLGLESVLLYGDFNNVNQISLQQSVCRCHNCNLVIVYGPFNTVPGIPCYVSFNHQRPLSSRNKLPISCCMCVELYSSAAVCKYLTNRCITIYHTWPEVETVCKKEKWLWNLSVL